MDIYTFFFMQQIINLIQNDLKQNQFYLINVFWFINTQTNYKDTIHIKWNLYIHDAVVIKP